MGVSLDCHIEGNLNSKSLLEEYGLEPGGRVQYAIDKACIDWCMGYVPWRTGALAMSSNTESEIGSGLIRYRGPNVRNLYYGNGILHYSTDVNPLAGSYWFQRMKADHLQDIMEEGKRAMGGR